ncbi:hypothetical protein CI238_06843, partial [Colletotrichum incanum]
LQRGRTELCRVAKLIPRDTIIESATNPPNRPSTHHRYTLPYRQHGACTARAEEVPRQETVCSIERQPQGYRRSPWLRCLPQHRFGRGSRGEGGWREGPFRHGRHPRQLSCHARGSRKNRR